MSLGSSESERQYDVGRDICFRFEAASKVRRWKEFGSKFHLQLEEHYQICIAGQAAVLAIWFPACCTVRSGVGMQRIPGFDIHTEPGTTPLCRLLCGA